ncbi:hypothetical protein E4T66_17775 [Sinimarinibacterium sp. CAU 1509]|uniref:hypothetical protein n=1 Tax=Sinimarinibacterium sp. CAU 1509 TaxID=2562283 RepID=UPI0010AC20E8|nr:hypothetical protein [Sinimarinibacterium sp. CAU 1509]TJY57257.1 hypothetical protein E4T66_17775 [Sinimarinibacterium sp. CAU 1509]
MNAPNTVSAQRQARDRRTALLLEAWPMFRPRKPVGEMSDDEVAAYLSGNWRFLGWALLVAGLLIVWSFIKPDSMRAPAPVLAERSAGTVESVEVHHTAFDVSSTVRTTDGTYQVSGAVSAAPGDSAVFREWSNPAGSDYPRLCVASRIKSVCYRLE